MSTQPPPARIDDATDITQPDPDFAPKGRAAPDPDATVIDPDFAPRRPPDFDATVVDPHFAPGAEADDDAVIMLDIDPEGHTMTAAERQNYTQTTQFAPFAQASQTSQASEESPLALPIGFSLHEYRVDSLLGQGGFGITYLATDVNLRSRVAVKEYLPGELAQRSSEHSVTPRDDSCREIYQLGLDSFLGEARTLATFRHPNIVRVARFFEANDTAYMVMEYERGTSLKAWWPAHNSLPEQELIHLLQPLLEGLAVVHAAGFLHRDIKPDNIYVRQEDGSLVLLDFGAAQQTSEGTHIMGSVFTPGYAPIEQYQSTTQGPWTDIYALGATLYWMLTGAKPATAPQREGDVDPMVPAAEAARGRYSPEFLKAVDWALQRKAEDRPQTIADFRRALFAAHAASLGLQEALHADDANEIVTDTSSWRDLLATPRLLKGRLSRFGRALIQPASWPIAVKMTLAMVLTALLPMLITAHYNLRGSIAAVSQGELLTLEQLAQSTAGRVSQLLGDNRNLANYLGSDADFVRYLAAPADHDTASIKRKLDNLVKSNPDVQLVMVMDRSGTALVSSDPEVMGRNFKFRDYFRSAIEGRPHTTGIIVGAVAGAAGMFYANPVISPEGHVIGAVVMRIKGASITGILDAVTAGSPRRAFLVDGDGIIIHHPETTALYRSLMPLDPATLAKIIADQRFRRSQIDSVHMPELASAMVRAKTKGNILYTSTLSGADEVAGYAPVSGHDWVVGITETRDVFAAPLNQLFYNVLYSVILVGLVFLVLALLFARSIVRPIERITHAAHALKSGDYDQATIRVTSNDEIGRLARTFNVMIDVLRQREREKKRREAASSGEKKP